MANNIVYGKRFANTFLDHKNIEKAINDEVMIDKETGAGLFYKKPDGEVVDVIGEYAKKNEIAGGSKTFLSADEPLEAKEGDVWEEEIVPAPVEP